MKLNKCYKNNGENIRNGKKMIYDVNLHQKCKRSFGLMNMKAGRYITAQQLKHIFIQE